MNSQYLVSLIVTAAFLFGGSSGQLIRQCSCSEVEPCKNAYIQSLVPCADSCQQHASSMGANYQALKQCILQQEPKIRAAVACTEGRHGDACSRGGGGMVPKRYPETLKIAALSEINRMLQRSGIAKEAKALLGTGKKMFGCVHSCLEKRAGSCTKKLGCGLALPSDNVLVQNAKQCAISSGFNTPAVQQLCHCGVQAGLSQLVPLCNRISIS